MCGDAVQIEYRSFVSVDEQQFVDFDFTDSSSSRVSTLVFFVKKLRVDLLDQSGRWS